MLAGMLAPLTITLWDFSWYAVRNLGKSPAQ
jgi:hypothetical protein